MLVPNIFFQSPQAILHDVKGNVSVRDRSGGKKTLVFRLFIAMVIITMVHNSWWLRMQLFLGVRRSNSETCRMPTMSRSKIMAFPIVAAAAAAAARPSWHALRLEDPVAEEWRGRFSLLRKGSEYKEL